MNNKALWKEYSTLFDLRLTKDNLKVGYLRSLVVGAGPLQDGDTRYENIKDGATEQAKI